MSCLSLFLDTCRRQPGRPALLDRGHATSYGALLAQAERCASSLARAGIGRGDRVVVLIPMSVELYAWIVGLLHVDATVMFVEPWMPLDLIAGCCRKAAPRAMLASPMGAALAQRVPAFRAIPLRLATRGEGLLRILGWTPPPAPEEPPPAPAAGADETAVLTFTTGSSGIPKGVVRTHRLLQMQHQILADSLRLGPDDVCLQVFANFILNNLALGAASLVPPIRASAPTRFSPRALAKAIARDRVTSIVCPPASLERLVAHGEARSVRFTSVTKLGTGGGPVPAALLDRATRVFPRADPEVLYGSSEVEPVSHIAWSELRDLRGEGACVGRPRPELGVRLLDHGEVAVSGPHVSPRYLDDPQAMADTKIEGAGGIVWHRMGDLARIDESGRLWLTGRLHNLIATAEGDVLPLPLERRTEALPFVACAAAVARGEPGRAAVVLAVEPAQWAPRAFESWRAEIAARVPEAKEIAFVRRIPRDRRHRSKIDYARLRERL